MFFSFGRKHKPPQDVVDIIDHYKHIIRHKSSNMLLAPIPKISHDAEDNTEEATPLTKDMYFLIGVFPVTVLEFAEFVRRSRYPYESPNEKYHDIIYNVNNYSNIWYNPITYVNYYDAMAFCEWYDLELPSEGEWERAACGLRARKFPWGNDNNCNLYANSNCTLKDKEEQYICNVYEYPKGISPFGIFNMSGNIWEWTSTDSNNAYNLERKLVKGGAWDSISVGQLQITYHEATNTDLKFPNIGFRCKKM